MTTYRPIVTSALLIAFSSYSQFAQVDPTDSGSLQNFKKFICNLANDNFTDLIPYSYMPVFQLKHIIIAIQEKNYEIVDDLKLTGYYGWVYPSMLLNSRSIYWDRDSFYKSVCDAYFQIYNQSPSSIFVHKLTRQYDTYTCVFYNRKLDPKHVVYHLTAR